MINNAVKREYMRLLQKWKYYKVYSDCIVWWYNGIPYYSQYRNLEYWARRDVEAFEQKINWRLNEKA